MELSIDPRHLAGWILICAIVGYVWMIHGIMLYALPDPFFTPDSGDYLHGALSYYFGGRLDIPIVRGLTYPLFLAAILRRTGPFEAVLFIQHLLAIFTAMLAAGIHSLLNPRRPLMTMALFMVVAIAPRALLLSHSILSECLFATLQMAALYAFIGAVHKNRPSWAVLGGGLTALALNTRPFALAILAAMGLLWLGYHRSSRIQKVLAAFMIGFFVMEAPFLIANRVARGFWGNEKVGAFYLFGNLAEYLDVTKVHDPSLRLKLAPFYTPEAKPRLRDKAWVRYAPEGPAVTLQNDPRWGAHLDDVFSLLGWQAFWNRPWKAGRDVIRLMISFLAVESMAPEIAQVEPKEVTLQQSIDEYYKFTAAHPAARLLLKFQPKQAQAYFQRVNAYHFFPFDGDNAFWLPAYFLAFLSYFLAVPAFLAGIALLAWAPRCRLPVQLFITILLGQGFLAAAGGTSMRRYGVPMEPLFFLLFFLGISHALRRFSLPRPL